MFFLLHSLLSRILSMLDCGPWPGNRESGPRKRASFVIRFVSVYFFSFAKKGRKKNLFAHSFQFISFYTSVNVNILGWMSAIIGLACPNPRWEFAVGQRKWNKRSQNCFFGLARQCYVSIWKILIEILAFCNSYSPLR